MNDYNQTINTHTHTRARAHTHIYIYIEWRSTIRNIIINESFIKQDKF